MHPRVSPIVRAYGWCGQHPFALVAACAAIAALGLLARSLRPPDNDDVRRSIERSTDLRLSINARDHVQFNGARELTIRDPATIRRIAQAWNATRFKRMGLDPVSLFHHFALHDGWFSLIVCEKNTATYSYWTPLGWRAYDCTIDPELYDLIFRLYPLREINPRASDLELELMW